MEETQTIKNLTLPSWEEIPDQGIYMTDLIKFLDEILSPLYIEERPISPSMVNNYVKHSYIKGPINRKYYRESLAQIIAIGFFKQVLSIDEITRGLRIEVETFGLSEVYNNFVEIFKLTRDAVFNEDDKININIRLKNQHDKIVYLLTLSIMTKLYTKITLNNR